MQYRKEANVGRAIFWDLLKVSKIFKEKFEDFKGKIRRFQKKKIYDFKRKKFTIFKEKV